ncbi:hypothetical protein [Micrococcus yunnanensis]|uniref:hypothetical protein n=1 Tax=Micrococcus yunnanensis TaxID=566027 RepID=UPI003C2F5371
MAASTSGTTCPTTGRYTTMRDSTIEWNEDETAEWIEDANPVQLFHGRTVEPQPAEEPADRQEPLPNGVDGILEHIAAMAAGYSSGLKWNEEDKLKADMMNRPDRWVPITVEQVRAKCRALGMRPDDVDGYSPLSVEPLLVGDPAASACLPDAGA